MAHFCPGRRREKNGQTLRKELEGLIRIAEISTIDVDYEFLAINFERGYWTKFAKNVSKLSDTSSNKTKYSELKEKLSNLIYSKTVLCIESLTEEVDFFVPCIALDAPQECKSTSEAAELKRETEKERFIRLKWALKYALEANALSSIMRISLELTHGTIRLPEFIQSTDSLTNTSEVLFKLVINLYQLNYEAQKVDIKAPLLLSKESKEHKEAKITEEMVQKEIESLKAEVLTLRFENDTYKKSAIEKNMSIPSGP